MSSLRSAILGFIVWTAFIYNVERVGDPINLASFVYLLVGLTAVALVGWRRLRRGPLRWAWLGVLAVYFPLKILLGYPIIGPATALPIAVTEVTALLLTVVVARQIGRAIDDFESAVVHLTVQAVGVGLPTFGEKQDEMYAEVARARRFKRPLTLMVLRADPATLHAQAHRVVEEVQRTTMERYALAKVARLIGGQLAYPAVVAQEHEYFFLLMPELTPETAQARAHALAALVRQRLNVHVRVGVVGFPDQALTFESLVELAKAQVGASDDLASLRGERRRGAAHHGEEPGRPAQTRTGAIAARAPDASPPHRPDMPPAIPAQEVPDAAAAAIVIH